MKKIFKRTLMVLIPIILILLGGCTFLFMQYRDHTAKIAELVSEMEANKQTVFVASMDIKKGDILNVEGEEANIYAQQIYTGLSGEYYLTAEELGSTAVVDIKEGVPIMQNMAMQRTIHHDTRVFEITAANLMVNQEENDVVDVRLLYPNGEDYLVLSKKQIDNLILESCIFDTLMSEEEILRYSSAVIDAYTISGARLYTTKYVESNIQEAAKPNYLVKAECIDLMNSDPNVIEIATQTLNKRARENLEYRLKGITEDQLSAVTAGFGLADTARSSVLVGIEQNEDVVNAEEGVEDMEGAENIEENTAESADTKKKPQNDSIEQTEPALANEGKNTGMFN